MNEVVGFSATVTLGRCGREVFDDPHELFRRGLRLDYAVDAKAKQTLLAVAFAVRRKLFG